MQPKESRYVEQLLEAYSDHLGNDISDSGSLGDWPQIERHFHRSREVFYHAECLRSYARDTVPDGTFEALQDEVHHGVIDICESHHSDGLARVRATVSKAGELHLASNALCSCAKIQDKHGICHQLANEDRLGWVRRKDA